jgi:outer membrane protein OmpA-like peptidoglycan-associated protein
MSRICIVGLVLLIGAQDSHQARAAGFDGQRFVPAAGSAGGLVVERPVVPRHWGFGAGLFLNYARNAVVLYDEASDTDLGAPLTDSMSLDLLASVGLFELFELAVHLPVHAIYRGDAVTLDGSTVSADAGVGDLRLLPKVASWIGGNPTVDYYLGLALPVRLPTGDADALRGAGATTIEPRLLFGLASTRWMACASMGYAVRLDDRNPDIAGRTALTYGLAGTYGLLDGRLPLDLQVELAGAYLPDSVASGSGAAPLELLAGAILHAHRRWSVYAAIGPGLTRGIGAPDIRAIAGVRFSYRVPGRDRYSDSDSDGILDYRDDCVAELEDYDGFRDSDGCPDPDNDGDGIADDLDQCPTAAEEPGGDGDGCPDPGRVVITRGRVYVFGKIQFASESDRISAKSEPLIDQIADALRDHPDMGKVRIVGHTDNKGSDGFNLRLSQRRAESVKRALTRRGIDPRRLMTTGLGEAAPVAPNTTPAGRAENRRVDFVPLD